MLNRYTTVIPTGSMPQVPLGTPTHSMAAMAGVVNPPSNLGVRDINSRVAPPLVGQQKQYSSRPPLNIGLGSASTASILFGDSPLAGRPPTPTHEHDRLSKNSDYEHSVKSTETNSSDFRAEAAENRLLRAMAHFSVLTPTSSRIVAKRNASFVIATISSRNELDQLTLWEDFATSTPVQYLNAELMTPSESAELRTKRDEYEMKITLVNGSLNVKLLPDLSVSVVQRPDADCREGDRIISADAIPVSTIEELRIALKGKTEILLVLEKNPQPCLSVVEGTTTYWEVDSIPPSTTIIGSLKVGDLILRVNDSALTGLDPRSTLSRPVSVSFLPGESALAQRIKKDGLMSFSTKVEACISKDRGKVEPKYNIILTRFDPDMYAGVYIAGVFLGRYQIGENFSLEIEEGPANATLSKVIRDGNGCTQAGVAVEYTVIGYDEAGNAKCSGGDEISCENGTVLDLKNGSYKISYVPVKVGSWRIDLLINGEAKKGAIECEVLPNEACLTAVKCDFLSMTTGQSLRTKHGETTAHFSVVAGNSIAITVTLYDKYGNLRPRAKDTVSLIQKSSTFKGQVVGAEAQFSAVGQGFYEFQSLVMHACAKDATGIVQYSQILILINGQAMREEAYSLDVLPGDIALKRCNSNVTASGITATAGKPFEFDVFVKDQWDNPRNRTRDVIEVFEYDNAAKQAGDRWRDYEVVASVHGTYRVIARSTVAKQSLFTFSINGSMTPNANCIHLLDVFPNAISIDHCVLTGQTTAIVGQCVQLMVSLRDEFGNIARPQQLSSVEMTVENVMMLSGNIDPSEVKLINRIARVDPSSTSIYTHQIFLSTQQALQVRFDIMLGTALFQKSIATFVPEKLDPRSCIVENIPRRIIAGEEFAISLWLMDTFKNGLSDLEGLVSLIPRDPKELSSLIKISGKDLGKGKYQQIYKIVKSGNVNLIVQHAQEIIHSAATEVLPAKAKAKSCELITITESPCFLPFMCRVILRDEFGNLAVPDESQVVVEVDRAMKPSRSGFYADSNGSLNLVIVPRTAGELHINMMVNDEPLGDRIVNIGHLSTWLKEDARAWLETLRPIEAQVGAVISGLSSEFVRQNVSGPKIVAGLLDRGALHFAFGLDERMAEFFASLIADLNRGPDLYPNAYLPWSWTTIGIPNCMGSLVPADEKYTMIAKKFHRCIGNATINSIERFESANLYEQYYSTRRALGFLCNGDCAEMYLWHGPENAANHARVFDCGFSDSKVMSERNLGRGYYFFPDPRLADMYLSREGMPADAPRQMILARVVCGTIAMRDPIPGPLPALAEELKKLENRMPPLGSQSVTSRQRTELVTFRDHTAYPEYVVTYSCVSPASEVAADSLLKLEDVRAGI